MSNDETAAGVSPVADPAVDDDEETLRVVSVLGGSRRVGRWRIPSSTSVMAVFGRTTLDLREVESQAIEIEIRCLSVFAGVTILVPKGADVRPAGTAILASTSCHIPAADEPSTLPPVLISSTTVLGKLHIQTEERTPRPPRRKRRSGLSRNEPSWDARTAVVASVPAGVATKAGVVPSTLAVPVDDPTPANVDAVLEALIGEPGPVAGARSIAADPAEPDALPVSV